MAKNRKKKGVNRRVAEAEIAAEPGMYRPPGTDGEVIADFLEWAKEEYGNDNITAEDLKSYREVAAAFPSETRNSKNSWEVHEMLKDRADRFDLIKRPWTEASLAHHLESEYSYVVGARDDKLDPLGLHRTVADVIRGHGEGKALDDPHVENMLLEMEAKGLIEALPDGQMLVKGTKAQLMEYGIDPTDKSIFDAEVTPTSISSKVPYRRAEQDEIGNYLDAFRDGRPDLALCHNPDGGNPMLFPREVLDKARANGESWVEYSKEEVEEWKRHNGAQASVSLVLNYNPDGEGMTTTKEDLDEAWLRHNREVKQVEQELGVLNEKVATAATNLLAATEDADTPGWTLQEISEHLGADPARAARIIDDMRQAGHLEVFERANGEPAFRLSQVGKRVALTHGDFETSAATNKQWFFDANETRGQYR